MFEPSFSGTANWSFMLAHLLKCYVKKDVNYTYFVKLNVELGDESK